MTTTLDTLLAIEGVTLAFEATPTGGLRDIRSKQPIATEEGELIAQFCASITMNFRVLAQTFSKLSGQSWVPPEGWAYTNGRWTVAVGGKGYRGVFIDTDKADFNVLFEQLVGISRPAG
ncbi:MAG: DUF2173 family protein [Betaproteobacteria bacterium]|nr:DUF2173 family protein [Betaproteobacteria bacterium]